MVSIWNDRWGGDGVGFVGGETPRPKSPDCQRSVAQVVPVSPTGTRGSFPRIFSTGMAYRRIFFVVKLFSWTASTILTLFYAVRVTLTDPWPSPRLPRPCTNTLWGWSQLPRLHVGLPARPVTIAETCRRKVEWRDDHGLEAFAAIWRHDS